LKATGKCEVAEFHIFISILLRATALHTISVASRARKKRREIVTFGGSYFIESHQLYSFPLEDGSNLIPSVPQSMFV
jgi:hypothetical protein